MVVKLLYRTRLPTSRPSLFVFFFPLCQLKGLVHLSFPGFIEDSLTHYRHLFFPDFTDARFYEIIFFSFLPFFYTPTR